MNYTNNCRRQRSKDNPTTLEQIDRYAVSTKPRLYKGTARQECSQPFRLPPVLVESPAIAVACLLPSKTRSPKEALWTPGEVTPPLLLLYLPCYWGLGGPSRAYLRGTILAVLGGFKPCPRHIGAFFRFGKMLSLFGW